MRNKKKAPVPIRRTEDITPESEMIITGVIFTCILGAIFLIIGGIL